MRSFGDRNRLLSVVRNSATVGTYTYNAFGERIAKTATLPQAVNERYACDEGSQLLTEYGGMNRDYVWLDDLPVAVVDALAVRPGVAMSRNAKCAAARVSGGPLPPGCGSSVPVIRTLPAPARASSSWVPASDQFH
ncbi:hypothetical protein [Frateuria defendens]|uniref:hypothetical protein n=1 Tax=Frateuria defendens TaxID=2219559 RepID=UPI00066FC9DB|nr:hypothetical protein [Frateuria defendens]